MEPLNGALGGGSYSGVARTDPGGKNPHSLSSAKGGSFLQVYRVVCNSRVPVRVGGKGPAGLQF